MSERSPRLRALRPRPQQQQQAKSETSPRRAEVKNKDGKDEEEATEELTSKRLKDHSSERNSGSELNFGESTRRSPNKKDAKEVADTNSLEDDKQYECKMCKPAKKYTTLKLYMQHLKNEHENKKKKVILF